MKIPMLLFSLSPGDAARHEQLPLILPFGIPFGGKRVPCHGWHKETVNLVLYFSQELINGQSTTANNTPEKPRGKFFMIRDR
jgi:hypothetical protein